MRALCIQNWYTLSTRNMRSMRLQSIGCYAHFRWFIISLKKILKRLKIIAHLIDQIRRKITEIFYWIFESLKNSILMWALYDFLSQFTKKNENFPRNWDRQLWTLNWTNWQKYSNIYTVGRLCWRLMLIINGRGLFIKIAHR